MLLRGWTVSMIVSFVPTRCTRSPGLRYGPPSLGNSMSILSVGLSNSCSLLMSSLLIMSSNLLCHRHVDEVQLEDDTPRAEQRLKCCLVRDVSARHLLLFARERVDDKPVVVAIDVASSMADM